MKFSLALHNLLEEVAKDAPLLVHSDLFRASVFVDKSIDRKTLLNNHLSLLESIHCRDQIWIPTFNYKFPITKNIDLRTSESELGPLNEYLRTEWGKFRSFDPIYTFSTTKKIDKDLLVPNKIIAFGEETPFATLAAKDGYILFYGADLSSITYIHHIERMLPGGPLYRYDKVFEGDVTDLDGRQHSIQYQYHVRPMNMHLDYHWTKLKNDLIQVGLFKSIRKHNIDFAALLSARNLKKFWLEKLKEDPLYLLDHASKKWVVPFLEKTGRRFKITDFEG